MTTSKQPIYRQIMPASASASALPSHPPAPAPTNIPPPDSSSHQSALSTSIPSFPSYKTLFPHLKPLTRLQVNDLGHPGAQTFLRTLHATGALDTALSAVLSLLYNPHAAPHQIPGTRSVTLILRPMDGVAYTTGLDLDDDHKEIHFNLSYIAKIPESRVKEEIMGVVVHEMVHCWQWSAGGSAPGGLIEGIADWIRLRANLGAPHWKRTGEGKWDAGYERTGYFLDWMERKFGDGFVRRVNQGLRQCGRYDEEKFWQDCCGEKVEELWKQYGASLKEKEEKKE